MSLLLALLLFAGQAAERTDDAAQVERRVSREVAKGEFEAARAELAGLLERADRAEWHNLLGFVEEKAKRLEIAAREYHAAARLKPSERHVFDLANFLLRYESAANALTIFRYGAEKHPDSKRLLVGLGIALYAQAQYDEAVDVLCRAVDSDPADPQPMVFLQKVYNASPRLWRPVQERLKGFSAQYPEQAAAQYYYALSLWHDPDRDLDPDRLPEAERLLQRAVALDPKYGDAFGQLGILYEQTGRTDEAGRAYRRAVELLPEHARYRYRLGTLLVRTSNGEEGARHLSEYRRLSRPPAAAAAAK